jgi:hypothetical protein
VKSIAWGGEDEGRPEEKPGREKPGKTGRGKTGRENGSGKRVGKTGKTGKTGENGSGKRVSLNCVIFLSKGACLLSLDWGGGLPTKSAWLDATNADYRQIVQQFALGNRGRSPEEKQTRRLHSLPGIPQPLLIY